MELPLGKIPIDVLKEVVFRNLGAQRKEVALGPRAGIDGAVIEMENKSVIVSMDPITGALERIGWLAVNINANDIATFGVEPMFFLSCMLLPEKAEKKSVETISVQMNEAARNLGIAIIGGHCETTSGLRNPIVVGCMMGMAQKGKYVTAGGAKARDKLMLTKSAGIEGTAILASDRQKQLGKSLSSRELTKAKSLYSQISVVKDALIAFRTGAVRAMHDPTEGGITGAIHEMADASGLGVKVFEEKIHVERETMKICKFYQIDPLQLIASGSLLIAAKPDPADRITRALAKEGIPSEIIGEFTPSPQGRKIILKNGKTESLERPVTDQLWQALAK
jgi:hydrogenase maturation factor